MIVLAIDPAVKKSSWGAVFADGAFSTAGPIPALLCEPDAVVIERPKIRPRTRINPQTVVDLGCEAMRVAYRFGVPVAEYEPAAWKGHLPKPVSHAQAWAELTPAEKYRWRSETQWPGTDRVIAAAQERGARDGWKPGKNYYTRADTILGVPDALDALALGLTHLGRLLGPRGFRRVEPK